MKGNVFAVLVLLFAGTTVFAKCPDCGSTKRPKIVFRCKKCKKTFCNECAEAFPGWNMWSENTPMNGTVKCECGATSKLEGTIIETTCDGDIRMLRIEKKNK